MSFRSHKIGGRDRKQFPDYADLPSRKHYVMSEQTASGTLGSIAITSGKTLYIDTIVLHNHHSSLKAQVIFTLTSTTSSPLFAILVPEQETVILTGLVGVSNSTSSIIHYQVGNANILSTGGFIGGWEVDSPPGL